MPISRALGAQRLELTREEPLESQIVADRRQRRGVGGERDGRDGLAVLDVANRKLGGEMLGIGGAAAIAEEQDLAAVADRRDGGVEEARERRLALRQRRLEHGRVLVEFAAEECLPVHIDRFPFTFEAKKHRHAGDSR
jgi:hypothetical protein